MWIATCVPLKISMNKLDLVPSQILAALVREFRNRWGLATGESYIPVVPPPPILPPIPLFHKSPCFVDVDFSALARNSVNYAILFTWVDYDLPSH